jgi:hypothetical protein
MRQVLAHFDTRPQALNPPQPASRFLVRTKILVLSELTKPDKLSGFRPDDGDYIRV